MRLLLAEDERDLADALAEILTINKFSVDVVHDGREALDYIELVEYDGVILDIMMPKIDGITVLKKIRERGNTVPIIMLTAKTEINDRVQGLDSGADDYLTKPFATQELLARIRAMTRREKNVVESVLRFSNVTLDRSTYELSSPCGSFKLSNKEFQLIEMLLNNVGKYLSTEHFMEKIWGYNSESEINVVWAHISNLRKKLSSLNANVEIKAFRNVGYSLEEKK